MSEEDDIYLRDMLDELVDQSLFYIGKIEFANRLLTLPSCSSQDREFAMHKKQELLLGLKEVRHCFEATLEKE